MKEIYQWVDWFEELVGKIANNEPDFLVEKATSIPWSSEETDTQFKLLQFGKENIDPFSFVYTLASKATRNQYKRVFAAVSKEFELKSMLKLDRFNDHFIFPTPNPQNTLFHRGDSFKPEILRELFVQVVNHPNSIDDVFFERAFSVRGVSIRNLTQALFLISPRLFLPIDARLQSLLGGGKRLPKRTSEFSWSSYKQILSDVKEAFHCEFYELNSWAFLITSKKLVKPHSLFYQATLDESNDQRWHEWQNDHVVSVDDLNLHGSAFDRVNRGDIILVRQNARNTKGIGIVLEKEYSEQNDSGNRLHVVWMNKRDAISKLSLHGSQFSRANDIEQQFRNLEVYRSSFEFLGGYITPEALEHHDNIRVVHDVPRNQILFGPPGTGKTWNAEMLAVKIIDGAVEDSQSWRERYRELCNDQRIKFVTFHQNYAYEDLIEGIRPFLNSSDNESDLEYEMKEGIFKGLCNNAKKNPAQNFVLIIDEINRGNISKIFGELITLIESSRRFGSIHETQATLPYSDEFFSVPNNLYIIGTMNTADRSIQLLDTALRRRFRFVELMPEPTHEEISMDVSGINVQQMLLAMNERIAVLRDREHQIGHTYFFSITNIDSLAELFKFQIFPLLQEYFFDDWSKIKAVLGGNEFVATRKVADIGLEKEIVELSDSFYERISLDDERWKEPEQYRRIYDASYNNE